MPLCVCCALFSHIVQLLIISGFWRRQWQATPVLLPRKSHGWRSLVGYSPWGRKELDMTERLHFHFSFSCIGEGNGNPIQCSCLENPRDGRAWWAAVYGVAQSRTRLKRLSSSKEISKDLGKVLERILLYSFALLVPTQSLFRLLFTGCSLSSFLIAHPTYSSKGSCLQIQKALFVQYPLSIILFFVFDQLTAFGQ